MKRLVRFSLVGASSITGSFVVDDAGWDKVRALFGTELYFPGNGGDLVARLDDTDFHVLPATQEWLDEAERLGINLNSGINPLDYV